MGIINGPSLRLHEFALETEEKIQSLKARFLAYNSRSLTKLEIAKLVKLSIETPNSFVSMIVLYTHYSRNNVGPLLFIDPYVMEEMFLLWNYGKPEAIQMLKEKVISMSGMDDVYELAYQMQNHLYGTVNKKALEI